MPLLSADEIATMRAEQNDTMPDTVVVWRYTSASDGMGGNTETWAAVGTVTGRIAPIQTGSESLIGEGLTAADLFVITVPTGTSVLEKDHFVIGGRTFGVSYINKHEAWETALRCFGYEVGG